MKIDINFICIDGSSYPVVFSKKAVLKKIAKFTGNICTGILLGIKLQIIDLRDPQNRWLNKIVEPPVNDRICIGQTGIIFPHNDD